MTSCSRRGCDWAVIESFQLQGKKVLAPTTAGYSRQEVAAKLGISVFTVQRNQDNIKQELSIQRGELIKFAREEGYTAAGKVSDRHLA